MELINPKLMYFVGNDDFLKKLAISMFDTGANIKIHDCLSLSAINEESKKNGEFPKAIYFVPKNEKEVRIFSDLRRAWRQVHFLVITTDSELLEYINKMTNNLDCVFVSLKESNGIPRGQFLTMS